MNKIEKMFKDKAIIKGKTLLFSKKNSIKFIEACENEGINILGIDCFLFEDIGSPLSLENSIDFTVSYAIKNNIIKQSLKFVNSFSEDHFFEIVCNR